MIIFINIFIKTAIMYMKNKLPDDEKRVKCSISLNKKINKLLEEVIEEKQITKSVLIENLLIEHFKNLQK